MPPWFPNWSGETCVIIAGGPSAKEAPLEKIKGRCRAIAINTSYRLCPWADVLYACDASWWRAHKGVPAFAGLKITQDLMAAKEDWGVKLVRTDRSRSDIITSPLGRIGWGGHGGFHANNLAVQFGAKRLLWVGFDMRLDHGSHWHGHHPRGLNNPSRQSIERWRVSLDGLAPKFEKLGVEVLNCSPSSALTAYRKVDLLEALSA